VGPKETADQIQPSEPFPHTPKLPTVAATVITVRIYS